MAMILGSQGFPLCQFSANSRSGPGGLGVPLDLALPIPRNSFGISLPAPPWFVKEWVAHGSAAEGQAGSVEAQGTPHLDLAWMYIF